jgi:RNA polymerase sigma-70 factor (ECF subfamily)
MMTDEQLMLDFQRGSKEAFTELFDRYREPVYGFFRRRVAEAARAEELAQETFLAVLRAVHCYESRALFRSYLYGIAFMLLMAERRKSSLRSAILYLTPANPGVTDNTESALEVRQALEKLKPDEREVLMLREYEQLSYAEIGAVQRVPVNTVRSRLFRARQAMKEVLMSPRAEK